MIDEKSLHDAGAGERHKGSDYLANMQDFEGEKTMTSSNVLAHEIAPIHPQHDFTLIDNPEPNPNVGLFTIKAANEWIDDARRKPMPCKLFGQLWWEHDVCVMFASANIGKSLLAMQIADSISRGINTMGLEMEAQPQKVLYFDFEMSEKQFQIRYMNKETGTIHHFSHNLLRVEINPDFVDYPNCDYDDFVKQSMIDAVLTSGAKVVIIDNLTTFGGGTEKAKDARPLMQWIHDFSRKNDISILVLAHTGKRSNTKPITMYDCFGSSMIQNYCDGMFAIGESAKGKSMRYIIELKQRTTNYEYKEDNVIECEIVNDDNFTRFNFVGYGFETEHLRKLDDNDRESKIALVKELASKGMSVRRIHAETGYSVGSVQSYIKK